MKKIFLSLVALLLCSVLCSCDSGLEIVQARIDQYPDRIVYLAGHDKTLDLSGGVISLKLKDGEIKTYRMDSNDVVVTGSIDFNKPGVYQIQLTGPLYFAIQVIDQSYISK